MINTFRNIWDNPRYKRYISYVFFGGVTTLINQGLYMVFTRLCGFAPTPSNIASVIISVFCAYFFNRGLVFRSRVTEIFAEMMKFFGARAFTISLEIFGMWLLTEKLGLAEYDLPIKWSINVVVIVLNYVFSRFLVFKREQ